MHAKNYFRLLCWLSILWLHSPLSASSADNASMPGVFDVTTFGAKGDGHAKDTKPIQAAIDAAGDSGGGTVVFPRGVYLSGTIYLKSRVRLFLSPQSVLLGSGDIADFPLNNQKVPASSERYTRRALIWGEELHDVGIFGGGTIDGNGAKYFDAMPTAEQIEEANSKFTDSGRYAPIPAFLNRPFNIRLIRCRGITVEGITLRDSPMWMQQYLECDNVRVRGITVYNHVCRNNDMIDIDGCRDVTISDCISDTDDDGLTLKSTSLRPTENVVITNCVLSSHCTPLKAGTESLGGFKNITIANCVICPSADREPICGRANGLAGLGFMIVDGGELDGLTISNMVIHGQSVPIFFRLGNRGRAVGPGLPKRAIGSFRNVKLNNIIATGASKIASNITGLAGNPIENVSIHNVSIEAKGDGKATDPASVPDLPGQYPESVMFGQTPALGFYCRHVRNLSFHDVEVRADQVDDRPAIVCDDVRGLIVDSVAILGPSNAASQFLLTDTREAFIRNCFPSSGTRAFLSLSGKCADVTVSGNNLRRCLEPFVYERPELSSAISATGNL